MNKSKYGIGYCSSDCDCDCCNMDYEDAIREDAKGVKNE